jgi:putative tryptophan/tyrosine transport system substrate-binding protein
VRRRDLIKVIAGSVTAWPLSARAQQAGKLPTVAFLTEDPNNPLVVSAFPTFVAELRKLGFNEGVNLIIESRGFKDASQASAVVAELIRANVDVLVTFGAEIALKAAAAATQTVPIVMIAVNFDPIAGGYVSNIARPSGNITGLVFRAPELASKQLELLVEAFPDGKPIAVLWESASAEQFNAAQRVAQSMHIELKSHKLETVPIDFDEAFRAIVHDGSRTVLVLSGPSFTAQRSHIADLAIKYRLPTMFTFRLYVEAGGLMSYGVDVVTIFRRASSYVAKILRGAKPPDLPVEQPSNFEFALNLKTAKAAGFTIPTSILLRADEVIE